MSNEHINGVLIGTKHNTIDFLNGVMQYDQRNSESGSGKMGTLLLCRFGISLVLPDDFNECNVCSHSKCEASYFTPVSNIKNVFLSVEGKQIDLSQFIDFNDVTSDKLVLHCKDFKERILYLPRKDESFIRFLKTMWQTFYDSIEKPLTEISVSTTQCCVSSFMDLTSWEQELQRLNVNSKKKRWKIIENKKFSLCNFISYYTVVPSSIRSDDVYDNSKNHSNQRFMTWCWTDSDTMVSLLRCSEPKTILDNSYLKKILGTVKSSCSHTQAVVSVARLKDSCPSEEAISNSFEKLWKACLVKDYENFYRNIDSCKWLHHIQSLVRASRHIARTLRCDKNPVVVMDQSGRDISCVIVSIVILLCDKYYRTINGFANLINKEWIAAGYKFVSSLMTINGVETSFLPTFVIFLDCVHNLILQYPTEFEFTDQYLITILDTIFYGDSELFMFNCPQDISLKFEGKENFIANKFWLKVFEHKSIFSTPLFGFKIKQQQQIQKLKTFDEDSHRTRATSYMYAVSKGIDVESEDKESKYSAKRRSTIMWKAIKRIRKKSKRKKENTSNSQVGSSSFFNDSDSTRERLTSIKNVFQSKFDPIHINYSMIHLDLWNRYYFRHTKTFNYDDSEILLHKFVQDIGNSCSDWVQSHSLDDTSGQEDLSFVASSRIPNKDLESCDDLIKNSGSCSTIASNSLECKVHVSEIDLYNDHVDRDYESAEELSLNSLDGSNDIPLTQIPDQDKDLSADIEKLEMSNSKSPLTVELEIAEATNDVQDF